MVCTDQLGRVAGIERASERVVSTVYVGIRIA